jgi:hypothetical protein
MDLWGFARTFNPDYLFAPEGEYSTRQQVNGAQTALITQQHKDGLYSDLEFGALKAELNQNTLNTLAPEDRPSNVFISTATENIKDLTSVRNTLGDVLSYPFKAIPPIGWVLIAVGILVYLEVTTGIFTRKLKDG